MTEENCDRIIRGGLIQYTLDVFDTKFNSTSQINPKIFSSALDTLVHIANTSWCYHILLKIKIRLFSIDFSADNGRTALRKSNKFNVLYKFSIHCPDDHVYNSTLSKLCTVINVCQEKLNLPLNSIQSSYMFDLGETKTGDDGMLKMKNIYF